MVEYLQRHGSEDDPHGEGLGPHQLLDFRMLLQNFRLARRMRFLLKKPGVHQQYWLLAGGSTRVRASGARRKKALFQIVVNEHLERRITCSLYRKSSRRGRVAAWSPPLPIVRNQSALPDLLQRLPLATRP